MAFALESEAFETFGSRVLEFASFKLFSVVGVLAAPAILPKSSALPGDFGVPLEAPNDAKAPEPKPKALDAPAVGDAMAEVG